MIDERDMWRAISSGGVADVRALLNDGVDANLGLGESPFDRPALDVAAEFQRYDICKLLIERGADPLGWPAKGRIPIKTAGGQFMPVSIRLPIVQLLLEAGADPNALGPEDDRTALAIAMSTRQGMEDLSPLADLMVRYGGDLNFVPVDVQLDYLTPAQRAVMGAEAKLLKFVLSRDEVDPFQKTLKGRSLLQICGSSSCVEAKNLVRAAQALWRAKTTQQVVGAALGAADRRSNSEANPRSLRRSVPSL